MWQSVLDWEKNMPENSMKTDSDLLTLFNKVPPPTEASY